MQSWKAQKKNPAKNSAVSDAADRVIAGIDVADNEKKNCI